MRLDDLVVKKDALENDFLLNHLREVGQDEGEGDLAENKERSCEFKFLNPTGIFKVEI